jgi:hypothetical protein
VDSPNPDAPYVTYEVRPWLSITHKAWQFDINRDWSYQHVHRDKDNGKPYVQLYGCEEPCKRYVKHGEWIVMSSHGGRYALAVNVLDDSSMGTQFEFCMHREEGHCP